MKYFLLLFILSIAPLWSNDKTDETKTLRYRTAVINGVKEIDLFKKALSQLKVAKEGYLKLKFAKNEKSKALQESETLVNKLENYMLEKYGMYPDITYIATPEAGTVSLLLTDEQLQKLSAEKTTEKKSDEEKGGRSRYPVFKLQSAKAVQAFISDAKKGDLIRNKIEELKNLRKEKNVEDQKKIAAQVKELEGQLEKYDEAMKKAYKIHSNLDYILDTTSLSVYMLVNSDDLYELGSRNKSRVEAEYKKRLEANK